MNFHEMNIPVSLKGCPFIAILTDSIVCGTYAGDGKFTGCDGTIDKIEQNLLEIRIFNDDEEFRGFRSYKGMEFQTRLIRDNEIQDAKTFDEIHYLDQNSGLTKPLSNGYTKFVTTGGGTYVLPVNASVRKVKVRNYLKAGKDSNGLLAPYDWRIVAFMEEETGRKEGI